MLSLNSTLDLSLFVGILLRDPSQIDFKLKIFIELFQLLLRNSAKNALEIRGIILKELSGVIESWESSHDIFEAWDSFVKVGSKEESNP